MQRPSHWDFRSVPREFGNKWSYWTTLTHGIPGFFTPNPLAYVAEGFPLDPDHSVAIVSIAAPAGLVILFHMKPVAAHLAFKQERTPWMHLAHTLGERRYRLAFILSLLLPTGGYLLMPFGTAYIVNNIGLSLATLLSICLVTGLCMVFMGPLLGNVSDSFGKFPTFCAGSVLAIPMIAIWTNLGRVSLAAVIVVNVVLFIGTFSRLVSSQALTSAIPEVTKRGAFNAINASLQQLAGGVSAATERAIRTRSPACAPSDPDLV